MSGMAFQIHRSFLPLALLALLGPATARGQGKVKRLAVTPYVLHVDGRVTDKKDRPLTAVVVRVDTSGVFFQEFKADLRGRFAMDLDIGKFYGINLACEGYVKKRFIIDARTEEPDEVITGPFHADISLTPDEALANVDINALDFPYALITYYPKQRSFQADPTYHEEVMRLEAALMLGSAFSRKRAVE